MSPPLLEVENLNVSFATPRGDVHAVQGVSLTLEQGKTLGVVGESGSGKTVLSRAVMGLLPRLSATQSGSVRYEGTEILNAPNDQLRKLWGTQIAMVFQDPMTSLNPVLRIGQQITEPLKIHLKLDRAEARETAISLLTQVGIPSPIERYDAYPSQLSGGMRQRVMIAIALACAPRLLMADEPTTGLDVTVQAQILDLLSTLQHDRQMGMVLVTHDLGVVATRTDEIIVMYAGNVVERAPTRVLFSQMAMPYTEALLRSTPRLANPSHTRLQAIDGRPPDLISPPMGCPFAPRCPYAQAKCHTEKPPLVAGRGAGPQLRLLVSAPCAGQRGNPPRNRGRMSKRARLDAHAVFPRRTAATPSSGPSSGSNPMLDVEDLFVSFTKGKATVQAVAGISFGIFQGETLGLVGESGCGKSTTGRAIVQVEKPTSGKITFGETELTSLGRSELRTLRTQIQMIFQDPISSLNPRRRVSDIVAEPLTIWKIGTKAERRETVNAMLESVGIDPVVSGERRPREFSGGQCQRISIARALVLEPQLLVCDEIVSALDVSVQAQILNLLEDLKAEYNLTVLFIAHDLAVVKNVSDRVAVMYLGRLCEIADSDTIYRAPAHHYTAALLSSAVEPDPDAVRAPVILAGEPPSPINPPSGCRFRTRCPRAEARCAAEVPELREIATGHQVACHFPIGT